MAEPQLTPTEHAILDAIREGRVDAEIAARLGISIGEVKSRVEKLQSLAGVEERAALGSWNPGTSRTAPSPSPPGASSYAPLPSETDEGGVDTAVAETDTAGTPENQEPATAAGAEDGEADRGTVITRRGLLLGAIGAAAAAATGGYFVFSRGDAQTPGASEERRFTPPSPTATPEPARVPSPDDVYRDPENWTREFIPAGEAVPGEHGIGFVDVGTGDIDLLRLNAPASTPAQEYLASPGNRFVSAWGFPRVPGSGGRAGIFDRESGISWAIPYAELGVVYLDDNFLVLQTQSSTDHVNREPGNLFFVVDAEMQELARFEGRADADRHFVTGPDGESLYVLEGPEIAEVDLRQGTYTRLADADEIRERLSTDASLSVRGGQVVDDSLYVDVRNSEEGQRYVLSVPGLSGHTIQESASADTPVFEPSPDGRYLLTSGTYRQSTGDGSQFEDWAYADVLTMEDSDPVLRAKSAVLDYGDASPNRHWLADSSGFVALVQDPEAPTGTAMEWMDGRWFAIIRLDGTVEMFPRTLREGDAASWAIDAAPMPSPDDPDLFSLGRSGIFDWRTGDVARVDLPGGGPSHLDPWGRESREMRFAFPHAGHGISTTGTVLPVSIEEPPHESAIRMVIARAETCVHVRADASVESESLGCLPDGVACELDRSNEPSAFRMADDQAFVRVQTQYGHRGWIAIQYLDWA